MGRYTDSATDAIKAADLDELMRSNHFEQEKSDANNTIYKSPFRDEKEGSFKIMKLPACQYPFDKVKSDSPYRMWKCYSTGKSGFGSIELQAAISGKDLVKDFRELVEEISSRCNIRIEEIEKGRKERNTEYVDPVKHTTIGETKESLTLNELRALGCESRRIEGKTDENGSPLYKYSFGRNFKEEWCKEQNFDPDVICDRFSIFSLSEVTFVPGKNNDNTPRDHSTRMKASDNYPMFIYLYENRSFGRIYQPLNQKGYKFSFWYKDGVRKTELSTYIYGDADVMHALVTGEVKSRDSKPLFTSSEVKKEEGELKKEVKFEHLIICSGGSDAINTYFHSEAHVCWLNSESAKMSFDMMERLKKIANNIYVMFDIDSTGVEKALAIAIKYFNVRVINLPRNLSEITDPKTHRPCKDAKNFFSYYSPANLDKSFDGDINLLFKRIMGSSKTLKFWNEVNGKKVDEHTYEKRYEINATNLPGFLAAKGMYRYVDEGDDQHNWKYVKIEGGIVQLIEESKLVSIAKNMMIQFVELTSYYHPELISAICNSKRMSKENLEQLPMRELNFNSWGKHFDHFFFKNTVVRVSDTEIKTVSYDEFSYHINMQAILPRSFSLIKGAPFTISKHPKYEALEQEIIELRKAGEPAKKELRKKEEELENISRIWKYKLTWNVPYSEQTIFARFLYNTGRVHWRKEKKDITLTDKEKQEQDMHFINKVSAIGYYLTRNRLGEQGWIVQSTDAIVNDEHKACGGTGKSLLAETVGKTMRYRLNISGKEFSTSAEKMSLNFSRFIDRRDTNFHIEDLRKDMDGELLYNITNSLTTKSLYKDQVQIPSERSPKGWVTANHLLDYTQPSTFRRAYPVAMSDYYHAEDIASSEREWNPAMEFGLSIPSDFSEQEYNAMLNMFCHCAQFFLSTQERILPPMDGLQRRMVYKSIRDQDFIRWADAFFSKQAHFNLPICKNSMFISYLMYSENLVLKDEKKEKMKFKNHLKIYCSNSGIVINPEVVMKDVKEDDRSRDEFRVQAWTTVFAEDEKTKQQQPRRQIETTRCMYFCRKGNEPRTSEDIPKVSDVDPDPLVAADENVEDEKLPF